MRDILLLRNHIFGLFGPSNPLCQHKYHTEREQKWPIFQPHPPSPFAYVT